MIPPGPPRSCHRATTELPPEVTATDVVLVPPSHQHHRAASTTEPSSALTFQGCQPQDVGAGPSHGGAGLHRVPLGTAPIPCARDVRGWVSASPVTPSMPVGCQPHRQLSWKVQQISVSTHPQKHRRWAGCGTLSCTIACLQPSLCAHGILERSHLESHVRCGQVVTTMCYNPGEHIVPYPGKGGTGRVPTSSSIRDEMVGNGQAVPALQGSEEQQVWIILGEMEEVEGAERKDFERGKNHHQQQNTPQKNPQTKPNKQNVRDLLEGMAKGRRGEGKDEAGDQRPGSPLLQEGSCGQVDGQGLLCNPFDPHTCQPCPGRQRAESESCCCTGLHPGEV